MSRSIVRIFVLFVLPGAVAACDDDPQIPPPVPPITDPGPRPVAPAGPYAVGTTSFDLTDPGRAEPHTESPDDRRRFVVRAWYPAAVTADRPRAPYFLNAVEGALNAQLLGLPAGSLVGLPTHATVDAPVAAAAGFPVVLFSPGRNVPVPFYSYLLEDLASRGYAVFALSHPYGAYGTGFVVFADGSVAEPFGTVYPAETRDELIATWSADQRFALGAIAALAGSAHPLAGRLDTQNVGVFGHSIGGGAAAQTCLDDPRFSACGNLDGSVGDAVLAGKAIVRPFLLMRAEASSESTLDPFFASLGGVAYQMKLLGGGHDSFSDFISVVADLRAQGVTVDVGDLALGTLSPSRRFEVVSEHVAAFFGAHLQGQPSALLTGSAAFPEIALVRRP